VAASFFDRLEPKNVGFQEALLQSLARVNPPVAAEELEPALADSAIQRQ
jgi:hypothetical protein